MIDIQKTKALLVNPQWIFDWLSKKRIPLPHSKYFHSLNKLDTLRIPSDSSIPNLSDIEEESNREDITKDTKLQVEVAVEVRSTEENSNLRKRANSDIDVINSNSVISTVSNSNEVVEVSTDNAVIKSNENYKHVSTLNHAL